MKCGGKERSVAWNLLRSSTSAEQTLEAAMEAKMSLCCMLIMLKDECTRHTWKLGSPGVHQKSQKMMRKIFLHPAIPTSS